MLFPRGNTKGDRSLDSRWVKKAKDVKRTVANVDLLSDKEIARWDLDDPERRPTGKKIPSNWEYTPPLNRANEPDARDEIPDARENKNIRDGEEELW